jgi:CubicO group peptidase (beta-lactamase class C family)
LYDFLETENTKGFIVLKNGRIALEKYFGTFTSDSIWYWASAGKTVTAFLAGKAQEEGVLDITNPTSDYLGSGWTSLTAPQEAQVTVLNQLTMTTGLDDGVPNSDCTSPPCLQYLADPGTRWAYHNAPYTLITDVISGATGQNYNVYLFNKLTQTIGMEGLYVPLGDLQVLFSKPRDMARFGLLMMAGGIWDGDSVMSDTGYLTDMITPSQNLNESYGYLWWLNGQSSYMLPGIQFPFSGSIVPQGPPDMYCGIGKNEQLLCVVPSLGLVVVRMGESSNSSFVSIGLLRGIWDYLNEIMCTSTDIHQSSIEHRIRIFPNPSSKGIPLRIELQLARYGPDPVTLIVHDTFGRALRTMNVSHGTNTIELADLSRGLYFITVKSGQTVYSVHKVVVN